jgi:hypothetical protein
MIATKVFPTVVPLTERPLAPVPGNVERVS